MEQINVLNTTGKPLYIQTLSGETIDVSPAVGVVALPAREVEANARIKKLIDKGVLRPVTKSAAAQKQAKPAKEASAKEAAKESATEAVKTEASGTKGKK